MNVQLAGLPMLPWAAPPLSYGTQAQHIMSTPVVVLKEVERVSTVIRVRYKVNPRISFVFFFNQI